MYSRVQNKRTPVLLNFPKFSFICEILFISRRFTSLFIWFKIYTVNSRYLELSRNHEICSRVRLIEIRLYCNERCPLLQNNSFKTYENKKQQATKPLRCEKLTTYIVKENNVKTTMLTNKSFWLTLLYTKTSDDFFTLIKNEDIISNAAVTS